MAYRFNDGYGGVTCDECNVLFDSDLSYKAYKEIYRGKKSEDPDICWKCRKGKETRVQMPRGEEPSCVQGE